MEALEDWMADSDGARLSLYSRVPFHEAALVIQSRKNSL